MQRLTQIPLDCCQGKQINFLSIQLSVKKTDPTLLPAHISTAVFFFFSPSLTLRNVTLLVKSHLEMTFGKTEGGKN